MNNASEIKYGLQLVERVARDFLPTDLVDRSFAPHHTKAEYAMLGYLEDTCVACFCAAPDLLSQWRIYGKEGSGYSIGFKRENLSKAGLLKHFDLVPMIYDADRQEQLTREYFTQARQIHDSSDVTDESHFNAVVLESAVKLSLMFKNKTFSEEKEWRLVSVQPGLALKYRAGRWGVIPYAEIDFERSCIAEIWQGPTLDYELSERTLDMYLRREYGTNAQGEGLVKILRSVIPLRSI